MKHCVHTLSMALIMPRLAPFGGWSAGINANADPKVIEAAYHFFRLYERAGAVQYRCHPGLDWVSIPIVLRSSRASTTG